MKRLTLRITSGSALALSLALAAAAATDPASAGTSSTPAKSTPPKSTGSYNSTVPSLTSTESTATGSGQITVATEDAEKHTERKFTGQEVKGSDGKDLGNVHEFLVNATSGKVEYAVISSGGVLGLGDKLRLVPISALQRSTQDEDEFTIALDRAKWDAIPEYPEDSLKADEVAITDSERRQIEGHFASASSTAMSAGTSTYTAGLTGHLLKASDLRGKDVKAGNQEIGSIESVVLNLQTGQARALFDGKSGFLGSNQKYLVPLNRFTIAGKRENATTTLTRSDFESSSTVSSSGTGALPVASTSSSPSTGNAGGTQLPAADTTAAASTSTTASTTTTTGAPAASASTAPSSGTTTTDSSLTMTGRDSTKASDSLKPSSSSSAAAADRTTKSDELAHSDPSRSPGSSAAGTPPPNDSTTMSRNTAAADVNSGNITTGPASSSSKGAGADKDLASSSTTVATTSPSTAAGAMSSTATKSPSDDLASSSTPSRSSNAGAASQPSANPNSSDVSRSTDSSLSPTGKTSSDQTPGSNSGLITAAQAVRKALDEDDTLSRASVVVTPENGKLVLRGSVTAEQKTAIEEKAERAASGQEVDSKLTVGGK